MPQLSDVYQIAEDIKKAGDPDAILLFGSIAIKGRGDDIDLLVVSRKKKKEAIIRSLYPYYKRYSIDLFTISKGELKRLFLKGSPFLRKINKEGRLIYMKNAIKYWKASAEEDLRQAEYLLEGGFYRGACYSAQQAIEKMIKCFLLKKGWDLEKTHRIRRLLAIGEEYGLKIKVRDEDIDFIDSIYIGRYPAEEGLLPMGAPTLRDARRAVRIAKKIIFQLVEKL
ncbi:MAG: HEPN domain-containing protein [Nitrospirae bacterium]|nr:MAG: HEPN domain-containing protein [Nitrospirota bacterium]